MEDFRFEQLDIWKEAIEVSDTLFDYAELADHKRLYKFAEQLRAAAMSISNNIAEGSGSFSDKEFASFLNISRRSVFECANILSIYLRRKVITIEQKSTVYSRLLKLSKMITSFRKTITANHCSEP
jgi:four helix bundle protein